MAKIPEVRYQSIKSSIDGFDLFQLESLYRSAPAMKFDLFSHIESTSIYYCTLRKAVANS